MGGMDILWRGVGDMSPDEYYNTAGVVIVVVLIGGCVHCGDSPLLRRCNHQQVPA